MDEASPLRSKLEATASRRLLLQVGASRDNPARRREAVWGRIRRRAAPNVSVKPCAGWRAIPGVAVTAAIAFRLHPGSCAAVGARSLPGAREQQPWRHPSSGSLGRRFDRVTVPRNATPKSNQDRSGIGAGSGSISVPTRGGCMAPRRAPSLASEGVRAVGPKEATTTGSSLDWERRPTPERLKSLRRRLIEKHACGRAQF